MFRRLAHAHTWYFKAADPTYTLQFAYAAAQSIYMHAWLFV